MAELCKNELIDLMSDKMGKKLELLIKQAMEIIKSLLIPVPPLVVDCFPNPDIDSGAYPEKMIPGTKAQDYLTTQSALFYSYEGKVEAKLGECSSIASFSDEFLTQFSMHSFRSEYEGNVTSPTLLEEGNLFEEDLIQMKNASQEGGRYCQTSSAENYTTSIQTINPNNDIQNVPITSQKPHTVGPIDLDTACMKRQSTDGTVKQERSKNTSPGKDSVDSTSSRSQASSGRQNLFWRAYQTFVDFFQPRPSEQAIPILELQSELTLNTPFILNLDVNSE